ncbi:MAG: PLP-dependent lyase/thiolase [Candidatus Wildermuthbacteria bacterium]|nr:PLP-dependent lyase/thiolase [Candidatus Wildermuthbacteria bacterium]
MFWEYNNYFSTPIPEKFQLSGIIRPTPLYQLNYTASKGERENIWIKDESANPTATHKDRSFQYWVSYWHMQDTPELVISSSGSAAKSAAYYCKLASIKLHIFVRKDFPEDRLRYLKQFPISILHQSNTPKKEAFQWSKNHHIPYLRASVDSLAIEGYKTLAFELAKEYGEVEEIFVPTSSGATIAGLYAGYKILEQQNIQIPRIYCVQTTMVHPIAEIFDKEFTPEKEHPARAVIDRIAHRKNEILHILNNTKGGGYIISKQELSTTEQAIENPSRKFGPESLLTFAAVQKHRTIHPQHRNAKTICIATN